MQNFNNPEAKTYLSPFSREYWKCALSEMTKPKMLVIMAMTVALRVAVKSLSVPVAESVNITFGFFINAVASMICGPVLALVGGAVCDTLGAVIFPMGPYFLPFMLVEMTGSFIFSLFLYKARLSVLRTLLSRFAVVFVCNIVMTPIINKYYYILVLGRDYTLIRLARVVKNVVLFPAESLLLVLFLGAVVKATDRLGLTCSGTSGLKIKPSDIAFLCTLALVAVEFVLIYIYIKSKGIV